MARFDYRKLSARERGVLMEELLDVMEQLRKKEDLQSFFLQLVTPSEAIMLARRWQVAKRLAAGQSYYRIARDLKVGMTTIADVDRWLSESIGDYRTQLQEARARLARRRVRRSRASSLPNTLSLALVNLMIEGGVRIWWAEWRAADKERGGIKKKT